MHNSPALGQIRVPTTPHGPLQCPGHFPGANEFADLEYVRAYIDDLLVLTAGSWEDHLEKLDESLRRVEAAGLKVNARMLNVRITLPTLQTKWRYPNIYHKHRFQVC